MIHADGTLANCTISGLKVCVCECLLPPFFCAIPARTCLQMQPFWSSGQCQHGSKCRKLSCFRMDKSICDIAAMVTFLPPLVKSINKYTSVVACLCFHMQWPQQIVVPSTYSCVNNGVCHKAAKSHITQHSYLHTMTVTAYGMHLLHELESCGITYFHYTRHGVHAAMHAWAESAEGCFMVNGRQRGL